MADKRSGPSRAAGAAAMAGGLGVVVAVALLLALTLIGGGAGSGAVPAGAFGSAAPARPEGVRDPATPTSAPADGTGCDDPRASLRPDGPLPAPGQPPAGSTMAEIVRRGFLIAGVNQNAYRVGFRDTSTGELAGFEIDIAREIARALFGDPDRIQYKAVRSGDRIPMIQTNQVDLVIRTTTMTCPDWRQVSFSTEYYTAYQRLLVPLGSPVTQIEDLAGKKVCAAVGSTSLTNIGSFNPAAIPVSANDVVDCLVLLQQGQIDAVSTSDILLAALSAQDPNTQIVGRRLKEQPYGIAMSRSAPDLVRFVNGVLDRMRADGSWSAVYARWLSGLGPASPPPARYR